MSQDKRFDLDSNIRGFIDHFNLHLKLEDQSSINSYNEKLVERYDSNSNSNNQRNVDVTALSDHFEKLEIKN